MRDGRLHTHHGVSYNRKTQVTNPDCSNIVSIIVKVERWWGAWMQYISLQGTDIITSLGLLSLLFLQASGKSSQSAMVPTNAYWKFFYFVQHQLDHRDSSDLTLTIRRAYAASICHLISENRAQRSKKKEEALGLIKQCADRVCLHLTLKLQKSVFNIEKH